MDWSQKVWVVFHITPAVSRPPHRLLYSDLSIQSCGTLFTWQDRQSQRVVSRSAGCQVIYIPRPTLVFTCECYSLGLILLCQLTLINICQRFIQVFYFIQNIHLMIDCMWTAFQSVFFCHHSQSCCQFDKPATEHENPNIFQGTFLMSQT